MRKLLFLFFVTFVFQLNAQSYKYDFKSKVDIEAAIQTTNLNNIYNQVGLKYLGYGYYLGTAISKKNRGTKAVVKARNYASDISKQGYTTDIITSTKFEFRQNGETYELAKCVILLKHGSTWYPSINRSEAIEVVSEMKDLLELGLISQKEYDEEFEKIKRVIK